MYIPRYSVVQTFVKLFYCMTKHFKVAQRVKDRNQMTMSLIHILCQIYLHVAFYSVIIIYSVL